MSCARRRGSVLPLVLVVCVVLIAICGLAVDTGYIMLTRSQLQSGADAAALAGVQQLTYDPPTVRSTALLAASKNTVSGVAIHLTDNPQNDPQGDIVVGRYAPALKQFTPRMQPSNAVKVVARRTRTSADGPLPLLFGGIVGVPNAEVQQTAIAMVVAIDAALIVLDPHSPNALTLKGNSAINLSPGAAIVVNSDNPGAISANGTTLIDAFDLYTCSRQTLASGVFNGTVHKIATPVADPLASIPEPDPATMPVRNYPDGTTDIQPGYYPNGLPSGSNLSLAPGIYAIKGNLTQNVTAVGVMFYFIDGTMAFSGNGNVTITPPTSGTYKGISIWQARSNASSCTFTGNGQLVLTGTIYMPAGHLEMHGTADSFGNQVVVNTLELRGNAWNMTYSGFPAGELKPRLVE